MRCRTTLGARRGSGVDLVKESVRTVAMGIQTKGIGTHWTSPLSVENGLAADLNQQLPNTSSLEDLQATRMEAHQARNKRPDPAQERDSAAHRQAQRVSQKS